MALKPAHIWSLTLGCSAALWIAVPGFRAFAAILLLAHAAVLIWGIADIRLQFFTRAKCRIPEATQSVALTFDDGPDPELTPDILDLLKAHNMHATFFVIAQRAHQHPDIVKRACAEGHTIGCHDLEHRWTANFRMVGRMVRDIGAAQEIIAAITGQKPTLYRPPVGLTNPQTPIALSRLHMTCAGWNRSAREGGNRISANIRKIGDLNCKPGDVILLHDCLPKREYRRIILENMERLMMRMKERKIGSRGIGE